MSTPRKAKPPVLQFTLPFVPQRSIILEGDRWRLAKRKEWNAGNCLRAYILGDLKAGRKAYLMGGDGGSDPPEDPPPPNP